MSIGNFYLDHKLKKFGILEYELSPYNRLHRIKSDKVAGDLLFRQEFPGSFVLMHRFWLRFSAIGSTFIANMYSGADFAHFDMDIPSPLVPNTSITGIIQENRTPFFFKDYIELVAYDITMEGGEDIQAYIEGLMIVPKKRANILDIP